MKRGLKHSPSENSKEFSNKLDDYCLILYNDEVNAYEYVVESLIEVCRHDSVQAEQCTFIAHHKGKCDIKKGSLSVLEPMKDELNRRGINTVISVV
ncbi:MAG: ATP-dependent Clp protease adaptor ClpS [Tenuifilaceae bacterium]